MILTQTVNLGHLHKQIVVRSTIVKITSLTNEQHLLLTVKVLTTSQIMRHKATLKKMQQTAHNLKWTLDGHTYAKSASQLSKKQKRISILATVSTKFVSSAIKDRSKKKKESVPTASSITIQQGSRSTNKLESIAIINLLLLPQTFQTTELSRSTASIQNYTIAKNPFKKLKFKLNIK